MFRENNAVLLLPRPEASVSDSLFKVSAEPTSDIKTHFSTGHILRQTNAKSHVCLPVENEKHLCWHIIHVYVGGWGFYRPTGPP